MMKYLSLSVCLLLTAMAASAAENTTVDAAPTLPSATVIAVAKHPTQANAEAYLTDRERIIAKSNEVVKIARMEGLIGAVYAPGVYGVAKCLHGVTILSDVAQASILVELDGVRFTGIAYPDRSSQRVLVKVTSMTTTSKDGQVKTKEVDGYLQDDKDGKPGLVADFSVTDNALTLKAGSTGRMVFLRSITVN